MSTQANDTTSPKLAAFQAILTEVASSPDEAKRYAQAVTDPDSLAAYCAEKGLVLTDEEATKVFNAMQQGQEQFLKAIIPEDRELTDAELEGIAGGSTAWWVVGAIAVGVVGALTGGVGLALAGAAFEMAATATIGAVGGGIGGAIIGGVGGAVAETIHDALS